MATFVLVPGAWLGGWLWQRLTPLLWEAGHTVYPLTLTGLGERAHLLGPEVDLDTHITDVVNVLFYEDMQEAILVGHSYGGMVIAGAADRVPERIRRLVYLDALAPVDGESLYDLRPEMPRPADQEDEWQLPPFFDEDKTRDYLPDMAEEDIPWYHARMTPHPIPTMTQPVRLANPSSAAIPRSYVFCQKNWDWDDKDNPLPPDVLRARTDPGWDFRELDSDHVPMLGRSRELAELLVSLIQ